MKESRLDFLAQLTNTSKATVSKTLNHCFGVEHETRQRILAAAREHGCLPRPVTPADVYVILPDTPKYFWGACFQGVAAEKGGLTSCKINIYSKLADMEEIFSYLDEAEQQVAQLVILSVFPHGALTTRLERLAARIPLFFLSEFMDITNTFFIGEDPYQSGYQLGQAYLSHFTEFKKIICVSTLGSANAQKRRLGFIDAVASVGHSPLLDTIFMPPGNHIPAAGLARMLDSRYAGAFDCVYCTDGILPQVCLAIDKLKYAHNVICLGHENPPGNDKYWSNGRIAACMVQNIEAQGKIAMRLAADYVERLVFPPSKFNYVPSALTVNPLYL